MTIAVLALREFGWVRQELMNFAAVSSLRARPEFQAKVLDIERPWIVDDVVVTMRSLTTGYNDSAIFQLVRSRLLWFTVTVLARVAVYRWSRQACALLTVKDASREPSA